MPLTACCLLFLDRSSTAELPQVNVQSAPIIYIQDYKQMNVRYYSYVYVSTTCEGGYPLLAVFLSHIRHGIMHAIFQKLSQTTIDSSLCCCHAAGYSVVLKLIMIDILATCSGKMHCFVSGVFHLMFSCCKCTSTLFFSMNANRAQDC